MNMKITRVCHECGSDDFVVQAEVVWNYEDQVWKVINFPEKDEISRIEINCGTCGAYNDYSYLESYFIEEE